MTLRLLRLIALLPLPLLHGIGKGVGIASIPFQPRRAALMKANMRQAGVYSLANLISNAGEFGKSVIEALPVWLHRPAVNLSRIREVHGWEAVLAAKAEGRGIVALTPHLGCWELVAQYISNQIPLTLLYRPAKQAWADELMRHGRQKGLSTLATPDLRGVRALLSALKQGNVAGILPDQVASKGDGVWVPFFGRMAYMPTLTHRLARSHQAAIFLFFCERLSWGRGYRLWVEPVSPLPEDPTAGTAALNRQLETLIRRQPAQYLWGYPIYRRRRRMGEPPEIPSDVE
jgi:KDO2-lipid IV(A) lauroyltransferase